jgi:hypothetical protein
MQVAVQYSLRIGVMGVPVGDQQETVGPLPLSDLKVLFALIRA